MNNSQLVLELVSDVVVQDDAILNRWSLKVNVLHSHENSRLLALGDLGHGRLIFELAGIGEIVFQKQADAIVELAYNH